MPCESSSGLFWDVSERAALPAFPVLHAEPWCQLPACSGGVGGQTPSLALPSGGDLNPGVNPLLFTLPRTKGEFSPLLRH